MGNKSVKVIAFKENCVCNIKNQAKNLPEKTPIVVEPVTITSTLKGPCTIPSHRESFGCDSCKQSIRNNRYHCLDCDDYDLCEQCMLTVDHQHEMYQDKGNSDHCSL
jgi:hypothetical protein